MKFVIETNLAIKPAWWLLDDDNRVAVRRVQRQACTAIGP